MRSLFTAFLVLALAAAPASAAKLKLKNGSTFECKVLAYDAPAKTRSVRLESGQEQKYTLDQLDARSVYLVNASLVPKGDAKAQLQVANFARDAGLYAHAVRRYEEAASGWTLTVAAPKGSMATCRPRSTRCRSTTARSRRRKFN